MELRSLLLNLPRPWRPMAEDAVYALMIILAAFLIHWLAKRWLGALVTQRRLVRSVSHTLGFLVRWGILLTAALLVLQQFGVLGNVWTALAAGAALVAVGFVAVWSVASNFLCTLLILISRPFQMGDELEIPADGLSGTVVDMGLLFTTLANEEGVLIQIPNNTFFQKPVKRRPVPASTEAREQS